MFIKTKISSLLEECRIRGVSVPDKFNKNDLMSILMKDSLKKTNASHGLLMRSRIESPMLCFSFRELTSTEKQEVLGSSRWIAEPKYYGCRVVICYHPEEGFSFFSRSVSDQTFLPIDFTNKILLNDHGILRKPSFWKGAYSNSFMMDGEAFSEKGLLRKGEIEPYLGFEQNYVSVILGLDDEEAMTLQATRFPLSISIFDLLYDDVDATWSFSLEERKKRLHMMFLINNLPFSETPYVTSDKSHFIFNLIRGGYEGSVLKNLDKPYVPSHKSRLRDVQVRIKRRDFDGLNDLDVFVEGFSRINPNALVVAAYIRKDDIEEEVVLGEIEVPGNLVSSYFIQLPNSDIRLPKAWLFGKVISTRVSGFNPHKMTFSSILPNWSDGFREDKNRYDCVIERDFIDSVVSRKLT